MTTIDPSLYLRNQQTTRTPSNELGKDDFLKILMTQLQNQDPTSPMEDREFISQLVQFTSLEQMSNMTNSINALLRNQQMNAIVEYSHLIDKVVTYQNVDENGASSLPNASKVIAVSQQNGQVVLELENGDNTLITSLLEVKAAERSNDVESEGEITKV